MLLLLLYLTYVISSKTQSCYFPCQHSVHVLYLCEKWLCGCDDTDINFKMLQLKKNLCMQLQINDRQGCYRTNKNQIKMLRAC